MKSLGVIETQGLVAAIQAVDAACKSAGVTCIGYRKVGSGLVSVCFEGEISAIHTAIERGTAVAGEARSLVIARPERCVVDALSNLKGNPPPAPRAPAALVPQAVVDEPVTQALAVPQPTAPAAAAEEKSAPVKKGKK